MKIVCDELQKIEFPLNEASALEFFAREGDWQTQVYASRVKSLEAWEIDSQFEEGLKKNLPLAKVTITDSFVAANDKLNLNRFDLIVLDNPQGCFGPESRYCEHFEALPLSLPMLKNNAVILFNINRSPFNYEGLIDWQLRRNSFYKVSDSANISLDFLLTFYKTYLLEHGFNVAFSFSVPRNKEYLSYMVFGLQRVNPV